MARRLTAMTTMTPVAFGDAASLTAGNYPFAIRGGSTTQLTNLWEVSISGQAPSSSSPTFMILSYHSTVSVGALSFSGAGAGGNDVNMNPATAALGAPVAVGNTAATTQPQRTLAGHLANCSVNSFGGVYFWRANRTEECFTMLGNANASAPNQGVEIGLSAFTGGTPGLIGCHWIYETL